MKKHILFVLLVIALCVLLSAFVYASEGECEHEYKTTSITFENDFCLNGGTRTLTCELCDEVKTEDFGNFATLVGYSASNNAIMGTYNIYSQAIKEYASLNKLKLNYGFIVASQSRVLEYGNPVNPQTGYVGKGMIKYDMINNSSDVQDVIISNIKYADGAFDTLLFISYYVLIGDNVYYIQNEVTESYENFEYVSFNMIKQNIESFGGFSKDETELSSDRLKQMNNSNSSYNTGTSLSDTEIDNITKSAQLISLGGTIFNYPNASLMLSHFLSGSGNNYTLDLDLFFKDKTALSNRNIDLNSALVACEVLANQESTLSFNQATESLYHNLDGDFWYAMGSYFTRIEISDLTLSYNKKGEAVYSATMKYIVEDFYNFDANDKNDLFHSLSPSELHELHKAGLAKEFLTHGEKVYKLSWKQGQRVNDLKIN